MWIMLLVFASILSADDMASEKYCFSSPDRAQLARQKFSMIQVPTDAVATDNHCLVVQMKPHRRELIQRYFLTTFPDTKIDFSSAETRREACKLKVEKEKIKTTADLDIQFSKQQGQIIKIDSKSNGNEVMLIETLNEFELSVNQDEIKGSCRYITPEKYAIEIEVRKNPKPVIVMNQAPPDQETSVIKSEIQLERGQRLNLGEVVKNINNKGHSADSRPSVSAETTESSTSERVFLSLQ